MHETMITSMTLFLWSIADFSPRLINIEILHEVCVQEYNIVLLSVLLAMANWAEIRRALNFHLQTSDAAQTLSQNCYERRLVYENISQKNIPIKTTPAARTNISIFVDAMVCL